MDETSIRKVVKAITKSVVSATNSAPYIQAEEVENDGDKYLMVSVAIPLKEDAGDGSE